MAHAVVVFIPRDQKALVENLLIQLLPELRRFASKLLRRSFLLGAVDSDDLVQDASLNIVRFASKYDPSKGKFRTWAFQILKYALFRKAEKAKKEKNFLCSTSIDLNDWFGEKIPPPLPSWNRSKKNRTAYLRDCCDVSGMVEREDFCKILGNALKDLPVEQRDVFIACEIQGINYEVFASIAGIPCGTVKSRLSRAKRKLASDPRIKALRD